MRDLTNADQNKEVLSRATRLVRHAKSTGQTASDLSCFRRSVGDSDPVELEAASCAESRLHLEECLESLNGGPDEAGSEFPVELSIVWAMYGETERIQPFSDENPHGEDFLRAKVAQIEWLTEGIGVRWNLVAVDDGCPHQPNSATVAQQIVDSSAPHEPIKQGRVTVLELADVLRPSADEEWEPPSGLNEAFHRLESTDDSRKGGSILYGLHHALSNSENFASAERSRHIVLYTDADLSTNLAQAGLLVAPIVRRDAAGVAGQRYGQQGAVLINESGATIEPASTRSKPDSMIVIFRHFIRTRLLPEIAHVLDTQAGFKAFDAAILRPAIANVASFDETFDVELLMRFIQENNKVNGPGLALKPIVFVEDFANSNFPSVDPGQRHLDMINQLIGIHDRLVDAKQKASKTCQELVGWLRHLTVDEYIAVIKHLAAEDLRRREAGAEDPLFDSEWPIDELQQVSRA